MGDSGPPPQSRTYGLSLRRVIELIPRVAILVAMSLSEQLPLADVKNRLSEVVDLVEREHGRIVITKHGRPAAVVMSIEDLESLEETLATLSSPPLAADIRTAETERAHGRTKRLSKDEALAIVRRT